MGDEVFPYGGHYSPHGRTYDPLQETNRLPLRVFPWARVALLSLSPLARIIIPSTIPSTAGFIFPPGIIPYAGLCSIDTASVNPRSSAVN